MNLQLIHLPQHALLEWYPETPVPGFADAGQHIQHGINARAAAPSSEVPGLHAEPAVPQPELVDQPVEPALELFQDLEVLVDV